METKVAQKFRAKIIANGRHFFLLGCLSRTHSNKTIINWGLGIRTSSDTEAPRYQNFDCSYPNLDTETHFW